MALTREELMAAARKKEYERLMRSAQAREEQRQRTTQESGGRMVSAPTGERTKPAQGAQAWNVGRGPKAGETGRDKRTPSSFQPLAAGVNVQREKGLPKAMAGRSKEAAPSQSASLTAPSLVGAKRGGRMVSAPTVPKEKGKKADRIVETSGQRTNRLKLEAQNKREAAVQMGGESAAARSLTQEADELAEEAGKKTNLRGVMENKSYHARRLADRDFYETMARRENFQPSVEAGERADFTGETLLPTAEGKAKRAALALRNGDFSQSPGLAYLTPDERDTFFSYIGRQDYERAWDYLEIVSWEANAREKGVRAGEEQALAQEHPWAAAVGNAVNSYLQPAAFAANLGQAGKNLVTGEYEPTDPNSQWFSGAHGVQNTAAGVHAAAVEWGDAHLGEGGGEAAGFLADTGLSILQNLAQMPFGEPVALILMSASAAGGQTLSDLQAGATPGQAALSSTLVGATEYVTEKLPIDNIFRLARTAPKNLRQFVVNILKQMGSEGLGEMSAEVIENAVNYCIYDGTGISDFEQMVAQLVAEGMSEEEAKKAAFYQIGVMNVVRAGVGGAISGGVFGTGAQAIGYVGGRMEQARSNETLRSAAEQLAQDGRVSNTVAETVLADAGAVETLAREAGLFLDDTMSKSERRRAVKDAVSRFARADTDTTAPAQGERTASTEKGTAGLAAKNAVTRSQVLGGVALGESGKRAYEAARLPDGDTLRYTGGFFHYYNAGMDGKPMGQVRSEFSGDLTSAQKFAAWTAGQNDAKVSLERGKGGVGQATVYNQEAGLIQNEYSAQLPARQAQELHELSRALGAKTVIDATAGTAQGRSDADGYLRDGVVHLAADADVTVVIRHELTHRIQELAPEAYKSFRDYALRFYGENAVQEMFSRYYEASDGRLQLSNEEVMDEIAAGFAGKLLTDEGSVKQLIHDDRTVARKFFDTLKNLVQTIKEKLGRAEPTLERAEKLWRDAFREAQRQAAELNGQNNAAGQETDGGTKYSIKFDEDGAIAVLEGKFDSDRKAVEAYLKGLVSDEVFSTVLSDAQAVYIGKDLPGEYTRSEYTETLFSRLKKAKFKAAGVLGDMILIADNPQFGADTGGKHGKRAQNGWYYYDTRFAVPVFNQNGSINHYTPYSAQLVVRNDADGKSYLYDIKEIRGSRQAIAADGFTEPTMDTRASSAEDIISQTGEEGNTKFSLKDTTPEAEADRLRELNEYLRAQMKRTPAPKTDTKAVQSAAKAVLSEYASGYDGGALSGRLQAMYDHMAAGVDGQGAELTYESLRREAVDVAADVLREAVRQGNPLYDDYDGLRSYLREVKLNVPRSMWADLDMAGGYQQFKKDNAGRLKLSVADGQAVDTVYKELSAKWPEFFDETRQANPADQLLQIADVLDGLEPVYESAFTGPEAEGAVEYLAADLIERFYELPQQAPTFADRQEQKLTAQKIHDNKKLERLRKEKNARIEEIRRQGRERVQDAVSRERARGEERVTRIKEHYAEIRQGQRERRADSRARSRLLEIAKRLQNKKMPEANRALLNQYIGELDTTAKSMTGQTITKLSDLKAWYETQKRTDPDFISDPATEAKIARLEKVSIDTLSPAQVAELTEVLLNIENEMRTKDRLIDEEDRRNIYHMGEAVISDVEAAQGSKGGMMDKFIVTETLSPVREMKRLTGYVEADPLLRVTNALADGQRAMLDYQMRAEKPFQSFAEDKTFRKTFSGAKAETIQITGMAKGGDVTVEITPAMRTALYLHSLNDQNLRHIRDGGITVPDMGLYRKGNLAEAYARGTTVKLTPSQVRSITVGMTAQERAFARRVHDYFNGMSRESINQVSEKLKGYSLAQVEDYFPIQTDTSFTKSDFESIKFDGSIEGMGFLKERVNAANPILLRDVDAVVEQSIRQHGKYVGMAVPVRNFNKIWGVTTGSFNDDGSRNAFESSVQKAIKRKWGETGFNYVEKMMADLQGGTAPKNNWAKALGRVRSNYAGAVLTLNLSVAMKQAASYPTAAAVLGWTPLVRAMADNGPVDLDLIAKYTPLQWYRSQGFSTKELGDLKNSTGKLANIFNHLPAVLNWVQGVDLLTTRKLWKASEYYVRDNDKTLNRGTDAYYRAVAEVYNRVIEETQPNYTTMQRPQLLRSDDSLMANLAMFKTQPFQNFNILYDAAAEYAAKRRSGSPAQVKTARKNLGRAVTSQLAQLAVFAGMTMAWALFRGKKDKYEDEEGDMSVESLLKAMGKDMVSGLFAEVPFGADAWELLSSQMFGDPYYGMDAVTVTALTDTLQSFSGLSELVGRLVKNAAAGEEIGWNAARLELDGYLDDISKAVGVPYENIMNLFNAVYRQVSVKISGKYLGEYQALKLTEDPEKHSADYYNVLYAAYRGDAGAYEEIYADMVQSGSFPEEKIKSAMEKRMKNDQGVESVQDLESRYLSPEQKERYDKVERAISGTQVYRRASEEQRERAEDRLYGYVTGEKALTEKLEELDKAGITPEEYLLYKLACEVVSEDGNDSSSQAEAEAAIKLLTGLTSRERAALWQSTNKGWKSESNPWG